MIDITVSKMGNYIYLEQDDELICFARNEAEELLEMIRAVLVTKWYAECPVCPAAFKYDMVDEPENPHPNGLMCPQCREDGRSPVGVLNFEPK